MINYENSFFITSYIKLNDDLPGTIWQEKTKSNIFSKVQISPKNAIILSLARVIDQSLP